MERTAGAADAALYACWVIKEPTQLRRAWASSLGIKGRARCRWLVVNRHSIEWFKYSTAAPDEAPTVVAFRGADVASPTQYVASGESFITRGGVVLGVLPLAAIQSASFATGADAFQPNCVLALLLSGEQKLSITFLNAADALALSAALRLRGVLFQRPLAETPASLYWNPAFSMPLSLMNHGTGSFSLPRLAVARSDVRTDSTAVTPLGARTEPGRSGAAAEGQSRRCHSKWIGVCPPGSAPSSMPPSSSLAGAGVVLLHLPCGLGTAHVSVAAPPPPHAAGVTAGGFTPVDDVDGSGDAGVSFVSIYPLLCSCAGGALEMQSAAAAVSARGVPHAASGGGLRETFTVSVRRDVTLCDAKAAVLHALAMAGARAIAAGITGAGLVEHQSQPRHSKEAAARSVLMPAETTKAVPVGFLRVQLVLPLPVPPGAASVAAASAASLRDVMSRLFQRSLACVTAHSNDRTGDAAGGGVGNVRALQALLSLGIRLLAVARLGEERLSCLRCPQRGGVRFGSDWADATAPAADAGAGDDTAGVEGDATVSSAASTVAAGDESEKALPLQLSPDQLADTAPKEMASNAAVTVVAKGRSARRHSAAPSTAAVRSPGGRLSGFEGPDATGRAAIESGRTRPFSVGFRNLWAGADTPASAEDDDAFGVFAAPRPRSRVSSANNGTPSLSLRGPMPSQVALSSSGRPNSAGQIPRRFRPSTFTPFHDAAIPVPAAWPTGATTSRGPDAASLIVGSAGEAGGDACGLDLDGDAVRLLDGSVALSRRSRHGSTASLASFAPVHAPAVAGATAPALEHGRSDSPSAAAAAASSRARTPKGLRLLGLEGGGASAAMAGSRDRARSRASSHSRDTGGAPLLDPPRQLHSEDATDEQVAAEAQFVRASAYGNRRRSSESATTLLLLRSRLSGSVKAIDAPQAAAAPVVVLSAHLNAHSAAVDDSFSSNPSPDGGFWGDARDGHALVVAAGMHGTRGGETAAAAAAARRRAAKADTAAAGVPPGGGPAGASVAPPSYSIPRALRSPLGQHFAQVAEDVKLWALETVAAASVTRSPGGPAGGGAPAVSLLLCCVEEARARAVGSGRRLAPGTPPAATVITSRSSSFSSAASSGGAASARSRSRGSSSSTAEHDVSLVRQYAAAAVAPAPEVTLLVTCTCHHSATVDASALLRGALSECAGDPAGTSAAATAAAAASRAERPCSGSVVHDVHPVTASTAFPLTAVLACVDNPGCSICSEARAAAAAEGAEGVSAGIPVPHTHLVLVATEWLPRVIFRCPRTVVAADCYGALRHATVLRVFMGALAWELTQPEGRIARLQGQLVPGAVRRRGALEAARAAAAAATLARVVSRIAAASTLRDAESAAATAAVGDGSGGDAAVAAPSAAKPRQLLGAATGDWAELLLTALVGSSSSLSATAGGEGEEEASLVSTLMAEVSAATSEAAVPVPTLSVAAAEKEGESEGPSHSAGQLAALRLPLPLRAAPLMGWLYRLTHGLPLRLGAPSLAPPPTARTAAAPLPLPPPVTAVSTTKVTSASSSASTPKGIRKLVQQTQTQPQHSLLAGSSISQSPLSQPPSDAAPVSSPSAATAEAASKSPGRHWSSRSAWKSALKAVGLKRSAGALLGSAAPRQEAAAAAEFTGDFAMGAGGGESGPLLLQASSPGRHGVASASASARSIRSPKRMTVMMALSRGLGFIHGSAAAAALGRRHSRSRSNRGVELRRAGASSSPRQPQRRRRGSASRGGAANGAEKVRYDDNDDDDEAAAEAVPEYGVRASAGRGRGLTRGRAGETRPSVAVAAPTSGAGRASVIALAAAPSLATAPGDAPAEVTVTPPAAEPASSAPPTPSGANTVLGIGVPSVIIKLADDDSPPSLIPSLPLPANAADGAAAIAPVTPPKAGEQQQHSLERRRLLSSYRNPASASRESMSPAAAAVAEEGAAAPSSAPSSPSSSPSRGVGRSSRARAFSSRSRLGSGRGSSRGSGGEGGSRGAAGPAAAAAVAAVHSSPRRATLPPQLPGGASSTSRSSLLRTPLVSSGSSSDASDSGDHGSVPRAHADDGAPSSSLAAMTVDAAGHRSARKEFGGLRRQQHRTPARVPLAHGAAPPRAEVAGGCDEHAAAPCRPKHVWRSPSASRRARSVSAPPAFGSALVGLLVHRGGGGAGGFDEDRSLWMVMGGEGTGDADAPAESGSGAAAAAETTPETLFVSSSSSSPNSRANADVTTSAAAVGAAFSNSGIRGSGKVVTGGRRRSSLFFRDELMELLRSGPPAKEVPSKALLPSVAEAVGKTTAPASGSFRPRLHRTCSEGVTAAAASVPRVLGAVAPPASARALPSIGSGRMLWRLLTLRPVAATTTAAQSLPAAASSIAYDAGASSSAAAAGATPSARRRAVSVDQQRNDSSRGSSGSARDSISSSGASIRGGGGDSSSPGHAAAAAGRDISEAGDSAGHKSRRHRKRRASRRRSAFVAVVDLETGAVLSRPRKEQHQLALEPAAAATTTLDNQSAQAADEVAAERRPVVLSGGVGLSEVDAMRVVATKDPFPFDAPTPATTVAAPPPPPPAAAVPSSLPASASAVSGSIAFLRQRRRKLERWLEQLSCVPRLLEGDPALLEWTEALLHAGQGLVAPAPAAAAVPAVRPQESLRYDTRRELTGSGDEESSAAAADTPLRPAAGSASLPRKEEDPPSSVGSGFPRLAASVPLSQLPAYALPGDVMLFRCSNVASGLQRAFTACSYDHVGVIVDAAWRDRVPVADDAEGTAADAAVAALGSATCFVLSATEETTGALERSALLAHTGHHLGYSAPSSLRLREADVEWVELLLRLPAGAVQARGPQMLHPPREAINPLAAATAAASSVLRAPAAASNASSLQSPVSELSGRGALGVAPQARAIQRSASIAKFFGTASAGITTKVPQQPPVDSSGSSISGLVPSALIQLQSLPTDATHIVRFAAATAPGSGSWPAFVAAATLEPSAHATLEAGPGEEEEGGGGGGWVARVCVPVPGFGRHRYALQVLEASGDGVHAYGLVPRLQAYGGEYTRVMAVRRLLLAGEEEAEGTAVLGRQDSGPAAGTAADEALFAEGGDDDGGGNCLFGDQCVAVRRPGASRMPTMASQPMAVTCRVVVAAAAAEAPSLPPLLRLPSACRVCWRFHLCRRQAEVRLGFFVAQADGALRYSLAATKLALYTPVHASRLLAALAALAAAWRARNHRCAVAAPSSAARSGGADGPSSSSATALAVTAPHSDASPPAVPSNASVAAAVAEAAASGLDAAGCAAVAALPVVHGRTTYYCSELVAATYMRMGALPVAAAASGDCGGGSSNSSSSIWLATPAFPCDPPAATTRTAAGASGGTSPPAACTRPFAHPQGYWPSAWCAGNAADAMLLAVRSQQQWGGVARFGPGAYACARLGPEVRVDARTLQLKAALATGYAM